MPDGLRREYFLPEAIPPEVAAFNAELEGIFASMPPTHTVPPEVTRRAREEGQGAFGPLQLDPAAKESAVPGPAGDVPIRLFIPEREPRGIYLHIHGGGWVLGRAHHQDPRNAHLMRELGLAVISVDYRLAPEHPYPAGPDDCEAVATWLTRNANTEFGTDRIVIGGESAGGHLAAVTLLRMRDRHGFTSFAGANLVYGVFDLGPSPSVRNWGEKVLVLSTPMMEWFIDCFVPREKRYDRDVSPAYADLRHMPPALFTIGTLDPLLDDTLLMYARWLAAGNQAEIAVYPGGVHGFNGFPGPLAREANARIDRFLEAVLQPVPA